MATRTARSKPPKKSAKKSAKKASKKPAGKSTPRTAAKGAAKKSASGKKAAAKRAPSGKKAPSKKKATATKGTAKTSAKKTAGRSAPRPPTKPATPERRGGTPERKVKRTRRPTALQSRRRWKRFLHVLLQKQRELTQAYNISKGDSRSRLDDGTEDYIDYAVSSYAREFLLSLTELDRTQLLLVEDALKRIDRGEYGRCLSCGEEIAPKRLEVAPWARHCLRCQELEEQGLLEDRPPVIGVDDDEFDEEEEVEFEEDELETEDEEEDDDSGGDDLTITEGED